MTRLSADLNGAVVVVTGPPGAGKSTVASQLVGLADRSVLIDGDAFFQYVKSGWIPPWEPESAGQNATVIDALGSAAGAYSRGHYVVFVEGVIGPWFLERFRAAFDHALHYVVVRPSREAAFARGTARPHPQLNDPVPMSKMYDEFESVGVYERCVVDNSMQTLDETVTTVAEGLARGRFRV